MSLDFVPLQYNQNNKIYGPNFGLLNENLALLASFLRKN